MLKRVQHDEWCKAFRIALPFLPQPGKLPVCSGAIRLQDNPQACSQ